MIHSIKLSLFLVALFLHTAVFAQEQVVGEATTRCSAPSGEEDIACPEIYEPVCAFRDSDSIGAPGETIANECIACNQEGFDYFVAGPCEDNGEGEFGEGEGGEGEGEWNEEGELGFGDRDPDVTWCEPAEDDAVCNEIYDPVCAYNDGDDEGTTVGNSCAACRQEGYSFYTNGECPQ